VAVGLFVDNRFVFSGVGDSRIYTYTDDELVQLTADDTWVAMMAEKGNVDSSVLSSHPMRHILTNVIGARDQIQCRVIERTLDKDLTFLFTSDGLDSAQIADELGSGEEPAVVAQRLVDRALERGGHDNITALVVQYRP
jgi:protein phosphatase